MTVLLFLAGLLALGFFGGKLIGWTIWTAAFLVWWGWPLWLLVVLAVPAAIFNWPAMRLRIVTTPLMRFIKKAGLLPVISKTEREALDAGSVWFEGELFSGKPDFARLQNEAYPELTDEEQAFLDGPVAEVCRMTDDWEVFQRRDLTPESWQFLRDNGFIRMINPKEYPG